MKLFILSAGAFLASLTVAAPAPTRNDVEVVGRAEIAKRATNMDACSIGYASTNNGTASGAGGATSTVSILAQFTAAVTDDTTAKVVVVFGTITGAQKKQSNIITRNIISANILTANRDGIDIQKSTNVWVDHCELYSDLYSDLDHGKDYCDDLVDITHASEWITVSNTYLHNHWKTSLIGHSDDKAAEDTGYLHVTQANNYWNNVGYVDAFDNDLGTGSNTAPNGTMTASSVPYNYTLLGSANVKAGVVGTAGASLTL